MKCLCEFGEALSYSNRCNSFFDVEIEDVNQNPAVNAAVFDNLGRHFIVSSLQSTLSIAFFDSLVSGENPIAECILEFDFTISAVCCDKSGSCVIAGDVVGNLHFIGVINNNCSLIFSHKAVPSSPEGMLFLDVWFKILILNFTIRCCDKIANLLSYFFNCTFISRNV